MENLQQKKRGAPKKLNPKVKVNITLDPALHESTRIYCANTNQSLSQFITKLIIEKRAKDDPDFREETLF